MKLKKALKVTNLGTFILFTLLFFISKDGKTQDQTLWNDLGVYGGQITSIAIDPTNPQVMYAGSWGGDSLFKTADGGVTWQAIPANNPSWFRNLEVYDIEIDPFDSNVIWVANNHYVDESRDGGEKWETHFFADDENRYCYSVAVDPFNSDIIYVGTGGPNNTDEYGEIFISIDGGDHWADQDFQSQDIVWNNFWQIKLNPNRQGEIWAANRTSYIGSNGLVLVRDSINYGWYYWSAGLWNENDFYYFGYIDEVLVHPTYPDKIFLSGGNGIFYKNTGYKIDNDTTHFKYSWNWTDFNNDCRAICMPPSAPYTLYAGIADRIVSLQDTGTIWKEVNSYPAPSEFLTLEPHPTDGQIMYAGSLNQGVHKTTDGAASWSTMNTGLRANTVFDTAVDPSQKERILCGTLAGVFIRETSAADWKQINTSGSESVSFDPTNSGTMFAGFDWSLGRSNDGGQTWAYLNTADQETSNKISSISLDPAGLYVYAAVAFSSGKKGELLKIPNTGSSFGPDITAPASLLTTPVPINAVAVSPHDPSVIVAGSGSFFSPVATGRIHMSRDGGQTWRQKLLPGLFVVNCVAFDPSDAKIIYAGCGASDGSYGAILKSTDGGITWVQKNGGMPPSRAVRDIKVTSSAAGSKVFAALYKGYGKTVNDLGGTYVSLDGGSYWTRLGLSDYRLFDVSLAEAEISSQSARRSATDRAPSGPPLTVYVGSGSGLMNHDSSIAGTGMVAGRVTTRSGLPLSNVYLSSTSGTGAQSDNGIYLMYCPSGSTSIIATAPGYIQWGSTSVNVEANGSTEFNIIMEPTGDGGNTGNCITLSVFGGSPYLRPLRAFRDAILKKTPLGREIISRYYALSPDIAPVLAENPALREKFRKLVARAAGALLTCDGNPRRLPRGFRDEAGSFLFDLERSCPARIKPAVNRLRSELRHFRLEDISPRQSAP